MHLSTIILTSIIINQQWNYSNIKSVLSSFKVVSLVWWNKRSADVSSRWPLQRRWAILCITNICLWWLITQLIWGRRELSIKRQTRGKSSGWGSCIGKADMLFPDHCSQQGGDNLNWWVESLCWSTSLGTATSWILDLSEENHHKAQVFPSLPSFPSQ